MCLHHRRDPKPPFLVPFPCPRDPDDGTKDVIRYGCALVCVRGRGVATETLGRTEAKSYCPVAVTAQEKGGDLGFAETWLNFQAVWACSSYWAPVFGLWNIVTIWTVKGH
ncbi:uncharacterized protein LOC108468885 [Gossypium arboreum]|uniref:uncharacterized protein LOC108468885 n=1 Tax=Gossypium arboreum TaxID=29729 RepID=UPI000819220E|nr:uncharacterized protein LOC108468885 [Gossypium arboreum]